MGSSSRVAHHASRRAAANPASARATRAAQESKRNCEVARTELWCRIIHIPIQRNSSMAKKRAAKKSRKAVRKGGKKKGGRKKK
jgi:hypothetical protein